MSKWADYLISAVKFNPAGTHIVKVRVHTDDGDTVGPGFEMDRSTVISRIDAGSTFVTIFKKNGQWSYGAAVKTVTIEGIRYIKTRADGTKVDNLDDLPRF